MFQGKSDSWALSLAAHLMKMTAADGVDLSVIHTQCRTHEKYKYCFFKAVSNLTLSNIFETGASSKQTKQTDPLGFLKLGKEHFKSTLFNRRVFRISLEPSRSLQGTQQAGLAAGGAWDGGSKVVMSKNISVAPSPQELEAEPG